MSLDGVPPDPDDEGLFGKAYAEVEDREAVNEDMLKANDAGGRNSLTALS